MAKTKKELERDLRIMTECYNKTHEEMMAYYFILQSLAAHYYYVAEYNTKDLFGKDFIISKSHGGKDVEELIKTIETLIKRGE